MSSLRRTHRVIFSLALLASGCTCTPEPPTDDTDVEPGPLEATPGGTAGVTEGGSGVAGSSGMAGSSGVAGSGGMTFSGAPAGGSGGGTCVPAAWDSLSIAVFPQQSSQLCWAGVTQMIAAFFGVNVPSQCQLLGTECPTCVGCPESAVAAEGPCNHGGWPAFSVIGLEAKRTEGTALALDDLKREISCFRRPVAFTWHLGSPFVGHIMLAFGYDGDVISIADPLNECEGSTRDIPYETYVEGHVPGTTTHWDDFYGIEKVEP